MGGRPPSLTNLCRDVDASKIEDVNSTNPIALLTVDVTNDGKLAAKTACMNKKSPLNLPVTKSKSRNRRDAPLIADTAEKLAAKTVRFAAKTSKKSPLPLPAAKLTLSERRSANPLLAGPNYTERMCKFPSYTGVSNNQCTKDDVQHALAFVGMKVLQESSAEEVATAWLTVLEEDAVDWSEQAVAALPRVAGFLQDSAIESGVLLDTGANHAYITAAQFARAFPTIKFTPFKSKMVKTAGSYLKALGVTPVLPLTLGSCIHLHVQFIVMEQLPYSVILGFGDISKAALIVHKGKDTLWYWPNED